MLSLLVTAFAANPPADLDGVEDPMAFERAGAEALAAGDTERAQHLFEEMLKKREYARYVRLRPYLEEALVHERMGRHDEAAAAYRHGFVDNILQTYQVLKTHSVHPQRKALEDEARQHVADLAARAERGEPAVIYHTKKGAPRILQVVTVDDVLEAARAGSYLRYCYLPSLDLRDRDLTGVERIDLNRCVVGEIHLSDTDLPAFWMSGFVLGDADLGKTWTGERNKSVAIPAGRFSELVLADTVFLGSTNLSDVQIPVRGRAFFAMSVFEGAVDFAGSEFAGQADFRFASFGDNANFRLMSLGETTYFAHARFHGETRFSGMRAHGPLYFASAQFDRRADFDGCEWFDLATFENARFDGPTTFESSRVPSKSLNLSRARFADSLDISEVELGGLDAFGAAFGAPVRITDTTIHGRTRFSVDHVTRSTVRADPHALKVLYRSYQGDEDAETPLTSQNSYGVRSADDLTATIADDISFANTHFRAYTVFEGVEFGASSAHTASFYNAQFLGETHFERTNWRARADFRTLFGKEIAFNEATFHDAFVLDDAYVDGRLTLTDATFEADANWSFYGAAVATFQIDRTHVDDEDGGHRLFYEHCVRGLADRSDPRIAQIPGNALESTCYARLLDEFVALKEAYGAVADIQAEDDAYWWFKHHETMSTLHSGSFMERIGAAVFGLGLFELCFGWGVALGNLGVAVLVITAFFAVLYRWTCPDTILIYDGEDVPVRDVAYVGLFFISLQTLMAINTGWDFGDDDHRFRYLNTLETLIGYIILTFFVGAYTRMILA